MLRVAVFAICLAAFAGCGVSAPTNTAKSDPVPKVDPKPTSEVYDTIAPMPREVKRD